MKKYNKTKLQARNNKFIKVRLEYSSEFMALIAISDRCTPAIFDYAKRLYKQVNDMKRAMDFEKKLADYGLLDMLENKLCETYWNH